MSKEMQTMDGNTAAAYISYAFTEVAGIYPITPSSNMAEMTDEWAANGKKNMFGQPVKLIEMQSEAGAAGTVHGSLQAGALTTTYTASQGLLLMIPNMYKIAGELLPCVIHVSARAVAAHALSIFGDHSDVMACRQTGFAMMACSNVQEVMDIGAVSHLATIKSRVPFLNFFDGFRTSHEARKIEVLDYEDLYKLTDHQAIQNFRANALNPEHPVLRGTAQNPDIFFQAKEAANPFYDALPAIVEEYLGKINELTGKNYGLFNYYGPPDADRVIIAMGSVCDCIEETIDYLNAQGEKVGLVVVHLYRPFSVEHLLRVIPDTVKKIAVLDRCKEPGALGDPLYIDVCTAFYENQKYPTIVGGRYGLGSKDVTPAQMIAVYENLKADKPKNHFTVGITDDVTHHSLNVGREIDVTPEGVTSCKFWGIGGDGTVGANKNSIKIIGDHRDDMYTQAYFAYDSKKSSGVTTSHLRFGTAPIRSSYLVKTADFVGVHAPSYIGRYDLLHDLKDGGIFLLNCQWSAEELENHLPNSMKREIARRNIQFYIMDGIKIARDVGLGIRVNTGLQAAFFKLMEHVIPTEDAVKYMKEAIHKTYAKRGEAIVNSNYAAVDRGIADAVKVEIPENWKDLPDDPPATEDFRKFSDKVDPEYIKNVVMPINAQKGEFLPVSTFVGAEDGTFPQGTSGYEKRGIALKVPQWIPENCIQCNRCSYVCPHATIRPFLLNEEEAKNTQMETIQATGKGFEHYQYRMQVTPLDCPGCGNCEEVCPGKARNKALVMETQTSQSHEMDNWYECLKLSHKDDLPEPTSNVRNSQFSQPLIEFSGACIGCGETPYTKLITQLFGDRMYIGNATGCSSIWGGSAPSTPFTTNHLGHGPSWANSLFEDTAEFSLGFHLAVTVRREKMADILGKIATYESTSPALKEACLEWVANKDNTKGSIAAAAKVRAHINECDCKDSIAHVKNNDDVLVKKSIWAFGGDGWAYDIGYGGVDHVIATGENVNIFVYDTEVYSNTGGQSSKSTPTAATAKFAAAGKRFRKKDLGMMAISYGNAYVAQIAMGADYNQTLKAIVEAEEFDGPSVVISYAPCEMHGIRMSEAQLQAKRAVEVGYWHMYRYNPNLEAQGKNPFTLDSKPPQLDKFIEHLSSETRYRALKNFFPEVADKLFAEAQSDAARRYDTYRRMAEQVYS
ncbi:MAG: pyruvate:ferredoxin (flavodoxin) oxidoreductase [Defluviitaleaceae bacterium]|nr:pyruvate:ferredoxin (flavodoxin) oxidoreductase [Defluviitaleaceae bacterium]